MNKSSVKLYTKLTNKLLVTGICLLLLFSAGCGKVVAYVNEEKITSQEFESRFNKMKAVYELQGTNFDGPIGKKFIPGLKQDVLEELIREKLILQEAKRRGITVSDQAVEQKLNQVKQEFSTSKDYQQSLDIQHIDEDDLRTYLHVIAIKEKLIEEINDDAHVSKQQAQQTDAFSEFLGQLEKKSKIRQLEKFD